MPAEPKNFAEGVRISMSCLAEFVSSPGRSPQARLRPYKFRRRGEGFARTSYYQPGLKAIRAYHVSGNDRVILDRAVEELRKRETTAESNPQRIRFERNVAAIEAYYRIYGKRRFKVLPNHRLAYDVGGITITARPDLWVEEDGTQVLLKVGMARHGISYIDMILSLLRKAAVKSGHRIRAKNFVYLNVSTGKELICSGPLTRFNRRFATGAREIADLWPTLTLRDA
jgi:hypothetical protein